MTSRETVERLEAQLSPEGRELLEEMRQRTEQTKGEMPEDELIAIADRAESLPDRELFMQAASYESKAWKEEALVEEAEGAALGGAISMIERAAELTGRDPSTLTLGEAQTILERREER